MTTTVQVTFDTTDPHGLADWWAEVLGWQVEEQDEAFIRKMVDEGHATDDQTTTHHGRLVWKTGAAINAPEGSGAPRLLFQHADAPTEGKRRIHLDLRPDGDDEKAALVQRLEAGGATKFWDASQGPHSWTTYADPEGNELCV